MKWRRAKGRNGLAKAAATDTGTDPILAGSTPTPMMDLLMMGFKEEKEEVEEEELSLRRHRPFNHRYLALHPHLSLPHLHPSNHYPYKCLWQLPLQAPC
mmetsp:Transcript_23572/g.41959  ORF Transcript_23572/g.41959 Transcript_23572/m.41959 type:complete len:99 (+) Transcript_23572:3-299(+)